MPNITISALPSATLPLNDPTTFFEVSVLEAGVEVSRKINLSSIATGVSFPLLAPDGSAVAPSYSFVNDAGAGMFLNALGELSLAADGVEIARAINGATDQFAVVPGSGSLPGLTSLNDLDTGFVWTGANQTVWMGGGSEAWNFTTGRFFSEFSQGPSLENTTAQAFVPTVLPDQSDANTGIGYGGTDEITLVGGGEWGVRYREEFEQVIQRNNMVASITASTTQTQGEQDLISSYNEVDNVANPNDVVTAPTVLQGMRLVIINNGANQLQVFPASGDDIGAGVNASITINAAEVGVFIGRDSTTWNTLYNGPPTPSSGVSFPLLAPDGTAGAPSYSFSGETDMGIFRLGEDIMGTSINGISRIIFTTSGITGFIGNSAAIISAGATANFPSILAANGDTNTGMGWGGIDIVTLAAGGIEGVRYAEAASHIIQRNENEVGLTASVTQTQVGGLLLRSSYNEISTVANSGDALTAFSVAAGDRLIVINNGANDLQLFPAVGDDFGAGVDTAITIAAGAVSIFIGRDVTDWDTLSGAGTSVNISDLVGGVSDDMLFNVAGVWTGTSASGLTFDGVDLVLDGAGKQIALTAGASVNVDDAGDIQISGTGQFLSKNGDPTSPSYAFETDVNTGIYLPAPDVLGLMVGAVEGLRFTELSAGVIPAPHADLAITAFATGGQGSATQFDSGYNVIGTVATTGDSVKLPPTFAINSVVYIKNDGANAADVFPATGDDLGAGVDTAVSLASGASVSFIATVANSTWTQLIVDSAVPDPLLLSDGSVGAPTYSFASDPDSGMWLSGVNQVGLGGLARLVLIADGAANEIVINGARLVASNANGPTMNNSNPNLTAPVFIPRKSDIDTGLSAPPGTTDKLSLIAGAIEAARYVELNGGVIATVEAELGITAFATGGQGSAVQLDHGYSVIGTVGTTGDSVKLPPVFDLHSTMYIKNDGANAADVFPATGDDLGAGVDTAISLASGASVSFIATVANSTWTQLIVDSAVPDPLLLSDGAQSAPTYSFASDPDSGMWLSGVNEVSLGGLNRKILTLDGPNNFIVLGGARFVAENANGPAVVNFNPTATIPVFLPRRSDGDTGLGAPAGTTDKVILSAGGIEGIRYTELNGGVLQVVNAELGITAFATGGQGSAVQLDSGYSVITTVGTTGDSVKLPPAFDLHSRMHIKNDGANAADVFPASGDDLGAGTDTAVSLAAGASIAFLATVVDATWTSF